MTKTGRQIENDIYTMIKNSALATFVNGGVYKKGLRPFNSDKEDVIVSFSAGIDGQTQSGMVTITVYVKNVNTGTAGGRLVPNTSRIEAIEVKTLEAVNKMIEDSVEYDLSVETTIQSLPVEGLEQNLVYCMLKYKRITF